MTTRKEDKSEALDATQLLKADHELVSDLFADYQDSGSIAEKRQLAEQICDELTVHAKIEEEIFYPAVKQALKDKELIPEAIVEHATLKMLISEVQDMEPDGEMFDAKIKVMSEYVKHHVKEEQNEIFPKAKSAGVDMMKLGAKMAERKQELRAAIHG
ncbi:MAG: hemerythrin domain-containing protein [Methylobacter sp.]